MATPIDLRLETLFHDLPPRMGDYDHFERLDMMGTEDFYPQTWLEVRMAFPLWFRHHQEGQTAAEHLGRVHIRQSQETVNTDHPEAAVQYLTGTMAAFALQARRDLTALVGLHDAFDEDCRQLEPDSTLTFDQLFRGLQPLNGPGQLLRDIDIRRVARDHKVDDFVIDPLGGEVAATLSGRIGIRDGYTRFWEYTPESIKQHMKETFGGYLAVDAPDYIQRAVTNQRNRYDFWKGILLETDHNLVAQPIARPVLKQLGLLPEFPAEELAESGAQ